jgi:hypothetical protein
MAFVVPTRRDRFEIRESRSTPRGPRSQTLASFRELTDEVIEKAREKATKPPTAEELRRLARRAGAPVARRPVDRAARELIAEMGKGQKLDPTLRHLLIDMLEGEREGDEPIGSTDTGPSISAWMAATPEERGRALVDLLLLTDALPSKARKKDPLRYPKLDSRSP